MIDIDVPGYKSLKLEYLVLDYNGTLAVDGRLAAGVAQILGELSQNIEIHVITADTFGQAAQELENLPLTLTIISGDNQDKAKREYTEKLGAKNLIAIGNGRNDNLMLAEAALGIAVILEEGAASITVWAADVVVNGIINALELLLHPKRLIATLRS